MDPTDIALIHQLLARYGNGREIIALGGGQHFLQPLIVTALMAVAGCVQAPPTLSPARTLVPPGGAELSVKRISDLLLMEVQVNGKCNCNRRRGLRLHLPLFYRTHNLRRTRSR